MVRYAVRGGPCASAEQTGGAEAAPLPPPIYNTYCLCIVDYYRPLQRSPKVPGETPAPCDNSGFPRESKSVMEGVKESVTATQLSCRRQDGDLGETSSDRQ